jgi:hypothetical protein
VLRARFPFNDGETDMAQLKVPSLQHLARNWRDDPERIRRLLVRLAQNPPTFNYNPLFAAVRDLLVLMQPYDEVVAGISLIKRESVKKNLLAVLPLIRDHFLDVHPDYYQLIDRRYYAVGRGLMVPFEPPMIYGVGGQLYFPWFSFWRRNPLARERLSLFVTLVDEVLMSDPDLETACFDILDFSVKGKVRELAVLNAADIPRLDEVRKVEMLEIFAEGFFKAQETLEGARSDAPAEESPTRAPDPDQPDMFDDPPHEG